MKQLNSAETQRCHACAATLTWQHYFCRRCGVPQYRPSPPAITNKKLPQYDPSAPTLPLETDALARLTANDDTTHSRSTETGA